MEQQHILSQPSQDELAHPRIAAAWEVYARRVQQIHLGGIATSAETAPIVTPPELDAQLDAMQKPAETVGVEPAAQSSAN